MSCHLRLRHTENCKGVSSVSHATLKNGLELPLCLFSVLALFITNCYLTSRLTVGTSANYTFYPILLSLRPTIFLRRFTLNGFLSYRPIYLGVLKRFPRSLMPLLRLI